MVDRYLLRSTLNGVKRREYRHNTALNAQFRGGPRQHCRLYEYSYSVQVYGFLTTESPASMKEYVVNQESSWSTQINASIEQIKTYVSFSHIGQKIDSHMII